MQSSKRFCVCFLSTCVVFVLKYFPIGPCGHSWVSKASNIMKTTSFPFPLKGTILFFPITFPSHQAQVDTMRVSKALNAIGEKLQCLSFLPTENLHNIVTFQNCITRYTHQVLLWGRFQNLVINAHISPGSVMWTTRSCRTSGASPTSSRATLPGSPWPSLPLSWSWSWPSSPTTCPATTIQLLRLLYTPILVLQHSMTPDQWWPFHIT